MLILGFYLLFSYCFNVLYFIFHSTKILSILIFYYYEIGRDVTIPSNHNIFIQHYKLKLKTTFTIKF